MLNSSRVDDWLEQEYLKTWIALEVLIGHSPERSKRLPLPPAQFDAVKQAVKDAIRQLPKEVIANSDQRNAMFAKLEELNRESIRVSALRFLKRVFRDYPAQKVTEDQLSTFISIRDAITHGLTLDRETSTLPDDDSRDYGDILQSEKQRLESLIERVILALFEERPNLMGSSWENWRDPR